jgi:hypothetical protein
MEKDWSERFEGTQKKRRHWRIVLGLVLVLAPSPLPNHAQGTAGDFGMYTARILIAVLGYWLLYSGFKPAKAKIPPDSPSKQG